MTNTRDMLATAMHVTADGGGRGAGGKSSTGTKVRSAPSKGRKRGR